MWLNGHLLGGRPYGYIGFHLDLTPYLKFGGEPNVLAVRLRPEDHSSRWYSGAGIYRNVWLDVTGPFFVAHWGTYVTTPKVSEHEDKNGNLCPLADNMVHFSVTGSGEIAAVDNGNAATEEPFQADHRKAFNGMALLIVRSKPGDEARIRIAATFQGLAIDTIVITTERSSMPKSAAVAGN